MNQSDFLSIEQLIFRFWAALDRRDYEALLATISPDCRWLREGWLEGRSAIGQSLQGRPQGLTTCHVMTNCMMETSGADEWHANYLVQAFSGERGADSSETLPTSPPTLIADVRMNLRRSGTSFEIASIEPRVLFQSKSR